MLATAAAPTAPGTASTHADVRALGRLVIRICDDFPVAARLIYQTLLAKMSADKEEVPCGDHQSG